MGIGDAVSTATGALETCHRRKRAIVDTRTIEVSLQVAPMADGWIAGVEMGTSAVAAAASGRMGKTRMPGAAAVIAGRARVVVHGVKSTEAGGRGGPGEHAVKLTVMMGELSPSVVAILRLR